MALIEVCWRMNKWRVRCSVRQVCCSDVQLLKERQRVTPLQLPAHYHLAGSGYRLVKLAPGDGVSV
jgi:hypothetical protein